MSKVSYFLLGALTVAFTCLVILGQTTYEPEYYNPKPGVGQ